MSGDAEKERLVKRTLEAVFALVARLGEPASEPRLDQAHISALRSGLRDLLPRIVAAATAEGHSSDAESTAARTPREPRPDPAPPDPARDPDVAPAPRLKTPPRPRPVAAPAPGAAPLVARTRPDGAVEVTFAGAMGLRLTAVQSGRQPGAEVATFVPLSSGEPGPASQCGLIAPGDRVVEVGGKPVERLAYADIVQALRAATKPFRVAFRRPSSSPPSPPPPHARTISAPAPLAPSSAAARRVCPAPRGAGGAFVATRPTASWAVSMGQYTTVPGAKQQFVGFAVCSALAPDAAAEGSLREAVWEVGQGLDTDPAWPITAAASQCALTAVRRAAPSPLLGPATAWRRYSDFEWLRGRLMKRFPWVVVPRVPAKVRARPAGQLLASVSVPLRLLEAVTPSRARSLSRRSATRKPRRPPADTMPTSSPAGARACCCGCAGWRATLCCAQPRSWRRSCVPGQEPRRAR